MSLRDYIPNDTILALTKSAVNPNGIVNQEYIDTAIDLIKQCDIGYKFIPKILDNCMTNDDKVDKTLLSKALRLNQKGMRDVIIADTIALLKDKDGNFDTDTYNKILNVTKLRALISSDVGLFGFLKFSDAKGFYELSKVDKKDFLMKLLINKSNLNNNHLQGLIPLLPRDDKEYANAIKGLTQSLNMSFEPLSGEQQKEFDKGLENLVQTLKNNDLSSLMDIKLTMPHSEFIQKINEILKDLPQTEQAKIQDYFGFRIVDDKLTGYPNSVDKEVSLSEITDSKTIDRLNQVKTVVDDYVNNNFITIKENPELNAVLKTVSRFMPEIFNQIGEENEFAGTIKSLQKVIKNPRFETLSDSDKKVMILATLLHKTDKTSGSTSESAFDSYFISKRFNLSDKEAQKLYKVVESSDLIDKFMNTSKKETIRRYRGSEIRGEERKDTFDWLAFKLKEDNIFELSQMLYATKEQDGLTRHLDKLLEKRIHDIKSTDFILPQTGVDEYREYSEPQTIQRGDNSYDVQVVHSEDIPNFYALVHTPEAGFATGGSRAANFANFDIFKDFTDDKVVCTSYVGDGMAGLVQEFHNGFIFDVDNDKQYVGYGTDIYSLAKNIPDMLVEYYSDKGIQANRGRGSKDGHRAMMSQELKNIMQIDDDEYIRRIDNIKSKLGGEAMTLEKLDEIDSGFADAYRELLSRDGSECKEGINDSNSLLRSGWHNEVLVSNPRISALFTDNIENMPDEYLQKAQAEGLPIVIVRT